MGIRTCAGKGRRGRNRLERASLQVTKHLRPPSRGGLSRFVWKSLTDLARTTTLHSGDLSGLWLAVIEIPLHLPVAEIELPLRATIQTRPVRAAVSGKGTAHLRMTTTKHPGHQTANPPSDRWRVQKRRGIQLNYVRITYR